MFSYLIDILLQLKRTVEVVSVLDTNNDKSSADDAKRTSGQGRIKTLLDCALSAGKAARNEYIVPEIIKLKEYGSDGTPPSALANTIARVRYFFFVVYHFPSRTMWLNLTIILIHDTYTEHIGCNRTCNQTIGRSVCIKINGNGK